MELGSEFELSFADLERVEDSIFEYLKDFNSIYMNSGRSAARLLNTMLQGKKILLPSYICDSVIDVYKSSMEIVYYNIDKRLGIDLEDLLSKLSDDIDIVYLMHYFGKVQEESVLSNIIEKQEEYHFVIIEDTTHSVFSNPNTIGDYCICSLRKWFPISDGAVLYSKNGLDKVECKGVCRKVSYPKVDAMILKHSQIHRRVSCNSTYREIFVEEEERVEQEQDNYFLSEISEILLRCFSVNELISRRKDNCEYLVKNLPDKWKTVFDMGSESVPLALPIYCSERDELREYLINNNIFCAVHWPIHEVSLIKRKDMKEMSESMLSLPIDQRYDKKNMEYLIKVLKGYKGI